VLGVYKRTDNYREDTDELETTVRLDKGTSAGLYSGFKLNYRYEDPTLNYYESVTVIKAAKDHAIAVVTREVPSKKCEVSSDQDCKIRPYVTLTKGLELSSARYR
jgi:hypothetical protein